MSPVRGLVRRGVARRTRERGIERLRHGAAPAPAIAGAVEAALAGEASPPEREWVERIEARREELNASEAVIAGADGEERVADVCLRASKPKEWGLILFRLIRELRPATCLEMGTCVGVSGAYQAAALELNGSGSLHTLEGSEGRAGVAAETFERLGLERAEVVVGRFDRTLDAVLADRAPIGFAFIDGHHDERATMDYFERVAAVAGPPGVLVFDDIDWSPGMERAWDAIRADEKVALAIDFGHVGLCVVDRGEAITVDVPLGF